MAKTTTKTKSKSRAKTPMILHTTVKSEPRNFPQGGGWETKTITTVVKSNSKYHPKYCQQMLDFFDTPLSGVGEKGKIVANTLPTFIRFARDIGVTISTLENWAKQFAEFREAYGICKELQKNFLMQNALRGDYNAPSFIFIAKNITDMRDDQPTAPAGGNTVNNYFLTLEGANDNRLEQIITEGKVSLNSGRDPEAEPEPSE